MSTEPIQYRIKDKELTVGDFKNIFKYPIKEHLEFEGMIIVLLDVPINVVYNENVFGVSLIDNHTWQIEKRDYPTGYKGQCPFTSLVIWNGNLRLNNWCSKYFIVNPWSGKIQEEGETR